MLFYNSSYPSSKITNLTSLLKRFNVTRIPDINDF